MLVGKPMVVWVLDSLATAPVSQRVVVVGHGADRVTKRLVEDAGDRPLEFVEQVTQRGTGDATQVGLTGLSDDLDVDVEDVLVLTGDTPLLRSSTIDALVRTHRSCDAAATVLTADLDDPTGYGRIVRGRDDRIEGIVEEVDANADQRAITEVNTGIFCFRRGLLVPALRRLTTHNAQGELYLTDVVEVLASAGHQVVSHLAADPDETHGINDRVQLATAERELRARINLAWARAGVTFVDPDRTYLDATVTLGTDVTLYPGTMLQGRCVIGDHADIGPDTQLVDTAVGRGAVVRHTVADRAVIGDAANVGPWACLGPADEIPSGAVTGPHYAGPNAGPTTRPVTHER